MCFNRQMGSQGAAAWHLAALLLAVSWSSATPANEVNGKYGWYWGDAAIAEIEAEKETKPERKPLPPPPSQAKLMEMHPDDINNLRDEYLKQAIWRTTPENVRDYYTILDTVRRKSLAFTAVSSLVMLENPALNVNRDYPTSDSGFTQHAKLRAESIERVLDQARESFGLVFFSSETCSYCVIQRDSLAMFHDRHGWEIKEVDINRTPRATERFDIKITPTIIVIQRNSDKWMPIAVGALPVPKLKENIYRAVRMLRGEITPEQFLTMDFEKDGTLDPLSREGVVP